MSKEYLNTEDLAHLMTLIKREFNKHVKSVDGKGLSTNDLTDDLLNKLDSLDPSIYLTTEQAPAEIKKLIVEYLTENPPASGEPGADGKDGIDGEDGADGVSCTHEWNGTVLTVTSASGSSSVDLKGEKGDPGEKGDKGDPGTIDESGIILADQTTGKRYKVFVYNGKLTMTESEE